MGSTDTFPNAKIRIQLKRILATPAFKSSRILSSFLEFVVEETLAGKEQEIKEYSIGVNVLIRNSDFNPQLDAIVRIHAGRLRRILKEYYYEAGSKDPIVIEIPKGSYIPVFHPKNKETHSDNSHSQKEAARSKPVVAILPFRNISKDTSRDFFADGLAEQLSTELTWFRDLSVISYYSSRHVASLTNDIKETGIILGAKYLLTGSIQNDDVHLQVRVQLISSEDGTQIWARSFEQGNTVSSLFEIQNEIVRNILTSIGGYYGAIFRDVLKRPSISVKNDIEIYGAVFWYYHFQKVYSGKALERAIAALEAAVKTDPDYALAWAMLGELYLDDKVLGYNKVKNAKEKGLKCALRAVAMDPTCQHGYQALAWIYLFHHDREECLKSVDQCIAVNPNAAGMVGGMGFVLSCAGEFERGFNLLTDSIKNNPYHPWWFNCGFYFYFFMREEYQQALHWAEKIDNPHVFWPLLLKAAVRGHLGQIDEATQDLQQLNNMIPGADSRIKDILDAFLLSSDLNASLMDGLRKAGLKEISRAPVQSILGA